MNNEPKQTGANAPFCKIPNWVVDDYFSRLNGSAVRVFVALSRFADYETNACYPSQRKLKKLLKCSSDTVANGIECLEQQGLIQRDRRCGQVNLYMIARTAEEARAYAATIRGLNETHRRSIYPGGQKETHNRSENRSGQNETVLRKQEHHRSGNQSATAPVTGAKQYLDNHTQEELSLFSSQEGLSADAMRDAHRLLIQVGVRGTVPDALVCEHVPESIINACKNGQAFSVFKKSLGRPFNLAGYVVKTLNQALKEGKEVKPTKWRQEAERVGGMSDEQRQSYREKKRENNHRRVMAQAAEFKKQAAGATADLAAEVDA